MPEARRSADRDLRAYLLEDAVEFRRLMSSTLNGYVIEGGQSVWDHLTGRVDVLLEGKEIQFSRYQLPDWHPESTLYGGKPHDTFVLGADDVLRQA